MGWSIGFDRNWNRDIGYGVPAYCDAPKCNAGIDRGLAYVCGHEEPYGGDSGCGLYFCDKHLFWHKFRNGDEGLYCKRCSTYKPPYKPKPEHPEWAAWKLKDESWKDWRLENPEEVTKLRLIASQFE